MAQLLEAVTIAQRYVQTVQNITYCFKQPLFRLSSDGSTK